MPNGAVKGGVIVNDRQLDVSVPPELVKLYGGKPRLVLKKLEWYGIHPLPIEMLSSELKALGKEYEIFAVPRGMLGP